MAMVHCRACGHQIHDSAPICPACGAPQGPQNSQSTGELPPGVKGWSWGAFLLNWVWGIFNGTWIALLALIPFVGFVVMIVLGLKGREWAWTNKRWDSLDHFNRVQRSWSLWGIWLTVIPFFVGIGAAIVIPAYQDYQRRAVQVKALREEALVASSAEAPTAAPTTQPVTVQPPVPAAVSPTTPSELPAATMPTEQSSSPIQESAGDLLTKAKTCNSGQDCVEVMLRATSPRRPDVLQVAAARLSELEQVVAGDKSSSRDLNSQGLAKYNAGDYEGAIQLFSQAAIANAVDAEVKANLGLAFVRAGKPAEAFAALVSALQLDPRRSNAWAPMAEAFDGAHAAQAARAALLLTYEFSGNKQKTIDFFRARAGNESLAPSLRQAYDEARQVVESGY